MVGSPQLSASRHAAAVHSLSARKVEHHVQHSLCVPAYDGSLVLALLPVAEIAVAEIAGPGRAGEQGDDAVLGFTFGAGACGH